MKSVIIAITGASGVNLGLKLINEAKKYAKIHAVISHAAKKTLLLEEGIEISKFEDKGVKFYDDDDTGAAIASGSFKIDAMIVAPCSINTLAKIHAGFADTLITRAAAVSLKERRRLFLAVREMPFSTISLEHMSKLSLCGAVIAPPILGYYSGVKTLKDMENFIIGKWLDLLDIENEIYKRWN
ncbi:UbiX family flavin prenyltransferase [Campylobacter californiensis]|uniref:UbiX family flavin prenyltransferase n=1 Tax=Campylobacter californiensis TaxID=1032243 RepID=UPI0014731A0D|nr:UbiX family flavin prenyltransferase [Campylobacter sp. RM12916]MBE3609232.1 UbiX family flavin prenyltransferase [Campylobacter sp. RM12916]